jgi:predicted DNA-binding transcriptional regulator YafY
MVTSQPHLARLRVERQHRLIEELRRQRGRHATADDLATALGVDVRTVERDITRLRDASPSPPAAAPAAASASTSPRRSPPVHLSPGEIAALVVSVTAVGPYVSASARSALTRLLDALQPMER